MNSVPSTNVTACPFLCRCCVAMPCSAGTRKQDHSRGWMVSASTSAASALLARSFLSSVSEWIQKRAFHGGDGSQQRCKRDLGIVVAEQMLEYRIWQVW